MLYIGIDGGGTKTKMVLFDENGSRLKELILPTVNVLTQPQDQSIEILRDGVNHLDPDHTAIIGAGLAGYGQQKELRDTIEYICKEAFGDRPFVVESDVRIAIEGALDGHDGIVVIAGTGSIALSLKNNKLTRCGGWGYQLGDEGSAYWIAKKMFNTFCKEIDGRLEKTVLYDLIMEECDLDIDYDIITFMNSLDRTSIASYAYINGLAANQGDPYAIEIYKQAALEIRSLIQTLLKQHDLTPRISYIGGVFDHASHYILPILNETIDHLISPIHTPEYGAYKLAKKLG